jgi:hypothetical protein
VFRASDRPSVNYQLVNRLISVNYSFGHVGTIRLTRAPHPLELLSHMHGISTLLAPEDSVCLAAFVTGAAVLGCTAKVVPRLALTSA